MIFWIVGDKQVENPDILEKEFHDIQKHGFSGVLFVLRASRYELHDPIVTAAVAHASILSHKAKMKFWVLADPRLCSRYLISTTGDAVDNLITTPERNKFFDGTNPSMCLVNNCRYSIRVEWLPRRRSHMFADVSLHFDPIGVEKVFLFRLVKNRVITGSVRDITGDARFFVNFNENYVEIFGFVQKRCEGWNVIAFPKFRTNIQDYASPANNWKFAQLLTTYKSKGIAPHGLGWDEPGYYAEFGRFPVSMHIYRLFRKKYGYDLRSKLYALLIDTDDNSHIKIRNDYYSLLMDCVFGAQQQLWKVGKKLFGPIDMGIHQTWHGESGGTEDMVHGSFDVWRGLQAVSGGYSDEGGAERLADPAERDYPNFITNMVLAKSLAKFSQNKIAYYNLWGVDFDGSNPKYPPEIMDYWVELMGVFSIKWLAHAYGWTGVLGEDAGFGPGYPNHATWDKFIELNKKIDTIEKFTKLKLPEANIALVYPIESLMAIGNMSGNQIAQKIFRMVYQLTERGYSVDMISPGFLAQGKYIDGKLHISPKRDSLGTGFSYEFLIMPYSPVLPSGAAKLVRHLLKRKFPVFFSKDTPKFDTEGKSLFLSFPQHFDMDDNPVDALIRGGIQKLFNGPESAYCSMMRDGANVIFALCPIRFRGMYEGEIQTNDFTLDVAQSRGIRLIRANRRGIVLETIELH